MKPEGKKFIRCFTAHDLNIFYCISILEGLYYSEILMLQFGELHVKHAVQRGIWGQTQFPEQH
jgi:hypothetical protein